MLKGVLDSQSWGFGLFSSLLHWLKELNFVPPDESLFVQLIQNLSLALVYASSSASLAAYVSG